MDYTFREFTPRWNPTQVCTCFNSHTSLACCSFGSCSKSRSPLAMIDFDHSVSSTPAWRSMNSVNGITPEVGSSLGLIRDQWESDKLKVIGLDKSRDDEAGPIIGVEGLQNIRHGKARRVEMAWSAPLYYSSPPLFWIQGQIPCSHRHVQPQRDDNDLISCRHRVSSHEFFIKLCRKLSSEKFKNTFPSKRSLTRHTLVSTGPLPFFAWARAANEARPGEGDDFEPT